MNVFVKRPTFWLAAVSMVLLAGCGGSGSGADLPGNSTGIFSLSVSDAGIDAAKVCIKFDGVELKMADDGQPMSIDFGAGNSEVINLLAYQGANSHPIVTGEIVPAGNYEWIRLKVDASRDKSAGSADGDPSTEDCMAEDGSYLVTDTGELYSLFIPSGDQSGLKLIKDITIPVNASGNYTAEWDLGKSFIAPPGLAPYAKMKPVVKLVANNEVGTLVGQVADELVIVDPDVEPEPCDGDFSPKVYVFNDEVTPNPIDYPPEDEDPDMPYMPDPNDPVATGLVERETQDDGSTPYRYSIGFLLAGDYGVALTCDGETFIPEDGKTATISIGEVTEVNFDSDDPPVAE